MPKVDQLVNNFAVYEDAVDYIGIAEVEFPELACRRWHPPGMQPPLFLRPVFSASSAECV